MSHDNRTELLLSLMAEVGNYSGAPTNSDDTDWNGTRPAAAADTDRALSASLRASFVFALSILILAGIMLNLVTVVTHLQTVRPQRTSTDRNGLRPVCSGFVAERCRSLQSCLCNELQQI